MNTLLIINMNTLVLEGIKSFLESQTEIELLDTGEWQDTLSLVEEHRPDSIIFEIDSSNFYLLDILRTVKEKYPNTNLMIMSKELTLFTIKEFIEIGVSGFLQQQTSGADLIHAITRVSNGKTFVPEYISDILIPSYQQMLKKKGSFIQVDIRKPFHLLTNKECDTLQLLAEGRSNKQIAGIMNISDKTVKNHVSSILLKMEVIDRTQAVLKAIKHGWVQLL